MKLWGGRFRDYDGESIEWFTASVDFDQRLYREDIQGSLAHAAMLTECGILTQKEGEEIARGLRELETDIAEGNVCLSSGHEDIHMNIEALLTDKIGDVGEKLHTARSRNDQVATDMHLFIKRQASIIAGELTGLQLALLQRAEENPAVIMPGYTHMQRAQPVLLAGHLLAYFFMLERDVNRLRDCARRADVSPLGCGALAGSSLPIDRQFTARKLGFSSIYDNSMDGVSDRDFVVELLSGLAIIMMHLSRLSEEWILWAGTEFSFIRMPDSLSTGSSIMPQKKNPDVLELVRGKTGRIYGSLMNLLTVMKGLPMTYNSDMQEDKEATFDAVDTVRDCVQIMKRTVKNVTFNVDRMREAVQHGFLQATDVADYLVKKGIPFRRAHRIVGQIVKYCEDQGLTFEDLSLEEFHTFSPAFEDDLLRDHLSAEANVHKGTSPRRIRQQIERARHLVERRQSGRQQ